jgi:hypothetical protein
MEYRYLGATGLKVSELGLGAMMFGAQTDDQASMEILHRFTDEGGNFIDTADVYGDGRSEEVLGRWLKTQRRDDHVIATKVWGGTGPQPNDRGLSRKHILEAVDASLRRLGTDYIDLYQLHAWDDGTPLTETLSTLDTLVRSVTSEPATSGDGNCRRRSTCAGSTGGSRSPACSRFTPCSTGVPSGSCSRCARTKASASSPGLRCVPDGCRARIGGA